MEKDTSIWVWDSDAIDWFIGAWKCKKCRCVNQNLGTNPNGNPFVLIGSKYCPECGRKMISFKR